MRLLPCWTLAALSLAGTGAPADRIPAPKPEACLVFTADPAEGEYAAPEGLAYETVTASLNKVLPVALHCPRPPNLSRVRLNFEFVIGCDGRVQQIACSRDDGAPAEYVGCVSAVIAKADFPAHDLPDGMEVTYPVNVSW